MPDVTAPFGFPYPEDTDLVRDGAADIEALAEGVNDQLALGFVFVGTRYYTSSGTFVKADPFGDSSFDGAKLRALRVRVQGAGGGAGGAASAGAGETSIGGGGGAGAFGEAFVTDIAGLATSVTVTRGSGGAGGVGGAAGSAGGQSLFGSVSANGGLGGNFSAASNAVTFAQSGTGSATTANCDITIAGSGGAFSSKNATSVSTAAGGDSFLGTGGPSIVIWTAAAGVGEPNTNPSGFGSGGGGSADVGASNARTGASGANGIVIVDVFA